MEALKFNRRGVANREAGFSMIEMLIATVVLSVGMLSLAGLMTKLNVTTNDSRYASAAALMASEKLEELAALPSDDDSIDPGSGHSAGSLTSDVKQVIGTTTVGYYDTVTLSIADGTISETIVGSDGKYITIAQKPDGVAPIPTANAPTGGVSFQRRWLVENNVSGLPAQVRRITVRVDYPSGPNQKSKFQISMVRNGKAS